LRHYVTSKLKISAEYVSRETLNFITLNSSSRFEARKHERFTWNTMIINRPDVEAQGDALSTWFHSVAAPLQS
jgi:hypothetical protein